MKKVFITIITLLAMSTAAMADGHVDSVRYLTTKAWKNWYISGSLTGNWWQGSLRTPDGFTNSYTAVEWGKPTFGFNVFLGKWINHKVAVRLGYSNTRINSYIAGRHLNLEHIQWLYGDDPQLVESYSGVEIYRTSMRYHRLQGDFMLSPIDFFQGYYNENRIWTPVFYVSMGGAYNCKDFFATKSLIENSRLRKENSPQVIGDNFELALGAGLSNNFRLGTHWDLNLDLNWTFQRWTIDSWTYEIGGNPGVAIDGIRPKRFDNMYTASVGVIYYFSREYDLPENCCNEMDSIKKKLDEFKNKPVTPQEQPCDTIVKFVPVPGEELVSYPFSIFFHCDSYQLMSRRDIVNLREIAKVAKEHGYKLRLTGSCDSATATPAYNQVLSENRCRKIKSELMKLDIPEDQIILVPIGGVKYLDPTQYDRRVLIELVK